MIGGIVHQEGSTFYFDGEPVRTAADVPRRPGTAGTTWYTTAAVSMQRFLKLLSEGDEAFGPSPDRPIGAVFYWEYNSKPKKMKVISSSVWGVRSRDPRDTENQIMAKMMSCATGGIRPGTSAAGTGLSEYMRTYDGQNGRPATKQLQPRWRGLAHASFHGGPIALTQAHAKDVAHIDLRAAYLAAMRQPLPVHGVNEQGRRMGGYYTFKNPKWSDVDGKTGFVDATVFVRPSQYGSGDVPPLPVRHHSGSMHPVGTFRGSWPICMVQDAVDAGTVEVLKVHQFCWAPETMCLFDEIADDFMVNRQGKLLYTRFWGKWASQGGFTGLKTADPSDGSVRSYGLWWEHNGIGLYDFQAPPTYRPDIAATIAGYNHCQVMQAVRKLKPGSIISLYVDAIWTTDIEGAQRLVAESNRAWAWKQSGEGRFYAPGVYHHGSRLGAAGYDTHLHGELTPDKLERWAASPLHLKANLMANRVWSDKPMTEPSATSTPVLMNESDSVPPCRGPDVNDPCWTPNGWLKPEYRDRIQNTPSEQD